VLRLQVRTSSDVSGGGCIIKLRTGVSRAVRHCRHVRMSRAEPS
jgi:hypothetical protein